MNNKLKLYTDLIYISSVVEGVDLTRKQVQSIVKYGSKSPYLATKVATKDILQAYGQKIALDLIERWAKGKSPITINYLLELHRVVFEKIDPHAGRYRQAYVRLRSSALLPSFPFVIAADMNDFNKSLIKAQKEIKKEDIKAIIQLVTKSYHQVTKIHPFSDGNGRTARLFVNLLLRRYGLPHIVIPKVDNFTEMREALREADRGNSQPLEGYMSNFINQARAA